MDQAQNHGDMIKSMQGGDFSDVGAQISKMAGSNENMSDLNKLAKLVDEAKSGDIQGAVTKGVQGNKDLE